MAKAIITFTLTTELDLDSPLREQGMSDRDYLIGWLFAANQEPELAMHCLDFEISVDGKLKEQRFGCHCELMDGEEPDTCVLSEN
jgi:hypothetical protein